MAFRSVVLAGGLLLTTGGCIISPAIPSWSTPPTGELTLSADQGFIVPAEINGHAVRLRVDTGHSGVILNPDVAARVALPRSMFGATFAVGPVEVKGQTGVGMLSVGGMQDERRIMWFDKNITEGADGIINIAALPYASVMLQLRPAVAGEAAFDLQTTPINFWSLAYPQTEADRTIEYRFAMEVPRTMVTAAAGAHLASLHGGSWAGEPFPHNIIFDVRRAVRPIRFERPVTLGDLRIDSALVRTSDFRGGAALPTDAVDPSEVVVQGKGRKSRAVFTATIGRDHLQRCSSMRYIGATRVLTLRCLGNARP